MKKQPQFECLEERVLLSGVPPYAFPVQSGVAFSYTADEGVVTCLLKGPGSGSWEQDAEGDLFVELNGTNSLSSLTINGYADIEKIDVNGDIKTFNAKGSDVEGKINILGFVKSLSLDDILAGANVEFNKGKPVPLKTYLVITADDLDGKLSGDFPISSAKLGSIGDNGMFDILGFVKSISVSRDIRGSYKTSEYTTKLSVAGNVIGADISVANGFKQGTLTITGNVDNSSIDSFYKYTIKGSLINSEVETDQYTTTFYVYGSMINSNISSNGINKFLVKGSLVNCIINSGNDIGKGSFSVTGGVINSRPGSFNTYKADSVDNSDIQSPYIKTLTVTNSVSNSEINTENGFKQGTLSVGGNVEGSSIDPFYNYTIKGSLVNTDVRTGGYTGKLYVYGSVIDSLIKSKNNLGGTFDRLYVKGDFRNSGLYVFYDPGADSVYGGHDDSLISGDAIKPLLVDILGTMENSWIGTARKLGRANLKYVTADNNGELFGLFCREAGSIKIGKELYAPGKFGDFTVEYIKDIPDPTPPDPF